MADSAAVAQTWVRRASPSEALRAVDRTPAGRTLVVDFDGTLFMRDSTEEYLNCLWPRPLGLMALLGVSIAQPWRWLPRRLGGGALGQDWMRVLLATLLLPWTPWIWRRRAARLAADHGNGPLVAALAAKVADGSRLLVVSDGLEFIIRPLLQRLLPCPFDLAARSWWKKPTGREPSDVAGQTLLGDRPGVCVFAGTGADGADRQAGCANTYLVQWPQMRQEPALQDVYAPLYYTQYVKRSRRNVVLQTIIAEDFAFWLLATSWLSAEPLLHAAGLSLLLLSFWCIYEIGYQENDLVAERYERAPKLSARFTGNRHRMAFVWPWVWAVVLALPGLMLLEAAGAFAAPLSSMFAAWLSLLVSLRLVYAAFNHVNKPTRIWIFPLLQGFRSFAPLVVTGTNYIGVELLTAHVTARSLHYFTYRLMGERASWPELPVALVRLLLIVFMVLTASLASGIGTFEMTWQLAAILAWCGYRARLDIASAFHRLRPIWREG